MNRTTDAPRHAAHTPALPAADGRMGYLISEDDHQRLYKVILLAGLLAEKSNDEALAEAAESVVLAVGRVHNNATFGTGWVDMAGGVA